jgi:hypothetical protein
VVPRSRTIDDAFHFEGFELGPGFINENGGVVTGAAVANLMHNAICIDRITNITSAKTRLKCFDMFSTFVSLSPLLAEQDISTPKYLVENSSILLTSWRNVRNLVTKKVYISKLGI